MCGVYSAAAARTHTQVFDSMYHIVGNNESYFYANDTFGYLMYKDPCQIIDTNSDFRWYINSMVNCTQRKWCFHNTFRCRLNDNVHCYHVEHIFDLGQQNTLPMTYEDKQIAANRVMSYGLWNMQLGRLAVHNFSASVAEKTTVYSLQHMSAVEQWIYYCAKKRAETGHKKVLQWPWITIFALGSLMILIALILLIHHFIRKLGCCCKVQIGYSAVPAQPATVGT